MLFRSKPTIDWEISEIDRILKKHEDDFMPTVQFSYGYLPYSEDLSFDELYTTVDQRMYLNKKAYKNSKLLQGGLDENQ